MRLRGQSGYPAEVDSQFKSMRVSMRPPQLGNLGAYQVGVITGEMAAGITGASEVFQFYWLDSTRLALVTSITCSFSSSVTGFTAGVGHFSLVAGRAVTVIGSGGAAPTLTTNNAKLRTDMGTTLISGSSGDLRVATTAALTALTDTDDAAFLGRVIWNCNTTAQVNFVSNDTPLFDWQKNMFHPIVLESAEALKILVTVPATGTWDAAFNISWQEVTAANWPNGS